MALTSLHKGIEFFLPSYPDAEEDEMFAYNIAKKKEFQDLRLERSEDVPDEAGILLYSQKFIKRFYSPNTPYVDCLVVHGIGTGKTCTISAIVENFKDTLVNGRKRKPALVFTVNEENARNIVNEVSTVCTKDEYIARHTEAELRKGVDMSKATRIARINKAVSQSYEIVSMETFLKKDISDDQIKKMYSDRVIIIDEAHRFRMQTFKRDKKKKDVESTEPEGEVPADLIEGEVESGLQEEGIDPTEMYQKMNHFLHTVENCRKFLMTGTPIWDRSSEIASLLNLILPVDQQIKQTGREFDRYFFDKEGNFNPDTIDELKSKMKGRVSYLRPMITTAKRMEQGTKEPWLKYVTIFPDIMSETQAAAAKEAREKEVKTILNIKGKQVERDIKGGTVLKTARDAMNMVLPIFDKEGNVTDVVYGPDAFKKNIVVTKKKRTQKGKFVTYQEYQIQNNFLRKAIQTNLREYSTKFASIIEDIKAHPNEIMFVYNEEVTGIGGSIMLGLCLQLHGFRWAKSDIDIKDKSNVKRFAVITSDTQTTNNPKAIQELIASSNRPDNRYGERLQVIIGSQKIALGISIKNVRAIHGVMPHWNISSMDQFEGRGLRFGGQDDLEEHERYVRIFRHAGVEPGEIVGDVPTYPPNTPYSDQETTDIYIYRIAEEKEHKNSQIYRLIKEEDFACSLFYNRNVLPEDVDGTRACDYQDCNYQCDGFPDMEQETTSATGGVWDYSLPAGKLDYSTYNLYFASGKVKSMINSIIDFFSTNFSVHINTLQKLIDIPHAERHLMLYAIDIIINSRTSIRNRYGFNMYLKEDNNMLFLDTNISQNVSYLDSTYMEYLFVTERSSMDSLIEIIELENDKAKVNLFCAKPTERIWESLSYKTKIILLEASYVKYATMDPVPAAASQVMDLIGDQIYTMTDGTLVHILYTEEFKGLAFSVAAKDLKATGAMRMYDPEVQVWKYVTSKELEESYIEEIKAVLSSTKEEGFENNPYGAFGWISKQDNSFRINLKQQPGKKSKIRGKKCIHFSVVDLVDIFIDRLGYYPEPKEDYLSYSRDALIKAIKGRPTFVGYVKDLDDMSDDQLRGFLTLITMRIEELCEELQAFFEREGLLYTM